MTRWFRSSTLLLALIVIAPAPSNAARQSKPVAREASPDYLRGRIPARFRGTSMPVLFDRVFYTRIFKDEFETEAQFQARLEALPTDTTLYAVAIPIGPLFSSEYDAESQTLTFSGTSTSSVRSVDLTPKSIHNCCLLDLERSDHESSTYSVQNAFGATRSIDKYTATYYSLYLGDSTGPCAPSFMIAMAPDSARIVKQNADRMLVAFRLTRRESRFIATELLDSLDPSLNLAIDIRNTHKVLNAELVHVWIFNYATGDVLYRHLN